MTLFLDLRHEQQDPPQAWLRGPGKPPKAQIAFGRVERRSMIEITGIVLHQTACTYGVSPGQLAAAGGDRALARNKRLQGIPAHGVVAQDGTAIANTPLSWYLYHGNGFNSYTLGIECEGEYDGRTNKKQVPTAQIEAARDLIAWMVLTARQEGAKNLINIYAHRQSNGIKPADPGIELWDELIVKFAMPKLGLVPRYDFVHPITRGSNTKPGRPIPKIWDASATAQY